MLVRWVFHPNAEVRRGDQASRTGVEKEKMTVSKRFCGLAAAADLVAVGGSVLAQNGVSPNVVEKCQSYVNAQYPGGQGSSDREREAAFRSCLRNGGIVKQ
jgi:hypothetical protein